MPYPIDLRTKIVTAYEAGKTSILKVAKQFMIKPKTVERLIKQNRKTGSLEPKKAGNPTLSQLDSHKELVIAIEPVCNHFRQFFVRLIVLHKS